jgi:hypothetical protein
MREPQPESRWRVSLPMYNLPEMQAVNADFWDAIRHELQRQDIKSLPASLDFARRPVPERIERDTLLTQVCGYPLQTIYQGQAVLLGAPVYGAEYCVGPTHTGVFVVYRESAFAQLADLRGCNFVYNSRHSNSGMNLPRRAIADIVKGERFFGSIVETHNAQPARQYRARSPPRSRCDVRRQCHLRVLLPASSAARCADPRAGGNATESIDTVRDVARDTRPTAGCFAAGPSQRCAI